FAADISVSMSIGQGSVLEDFFSVSLSARIILNTTGQEQGFQIPDRFLEFLDPDTIALLDADNRMVVRAGAPKPDGTYEPPGPYVFIQASGSLTIINVFRIEAAFRLKFSTVGLDLAFSGSLRLDPLGSLEAAGNLEIDSRGVIARVALSLDAGFGGDVGISFSGDALLEVNTTGQDQTIYLANGDQVVVGEGVRVYIAGSVEFLGFASASGSVTITVNSNQLTLEFDVTIVLGPFSLEVRGGAGVYYGSDPGLALLLDVSLDVNIFEIFKIQASGKLHLNTSKNTTRVLSGISLAPASFRLELHGLIKILEVLKFEAGFTIQVGAGEFEVGSALYGTNNTLIQDTGDWYFEFYASMDFFGLATLDANGWLNSKGHFDIFVAGELVLGTRSFGLVGDFAFHIYLNQGPDFPYYYRFGVTADASVSIRAFGISFASVGIGFSLTAEGAGLVPLVAKAYASIKILFIKISVSMSFTLGYIELPKPVFLAGDATGDTRQWTQSALDGGTGELHLNMGSRNSIRGIGAGAADESYIIEHMSGDADGETVKVIFSGRETIYKGVTKIVADAGDGADQILVREGVLVPVEFHGGSGGDALLHEGSGHAEIYGDSGVDYIETGLGSTTALLWGGDDADYIVHNGSGAAVIEGGSGADKLFGGPAGDVIRGGDDGDEIDGRGGVDTIDAGDGDDLIKWSYGHLALTQIHAGSGRDFLVVTATPGDDYLEISTPSNSVIKVARFSGAAESGSILADNVEELILDAGFGSDTIIVPELRGSGVDKVTVDFGNREVENGTRIVTDEDGIQQEVPILDIYDDGAADTLIIKGTASNDTFILSSVNPGQNSHRMQDVRIIYQGVNDFVLTNSVRSEGDRVVIEAYEGNNVMNAGGLGDPDDNDDVVFPDLVAVEMIAGDGDDTVTGSPFNDVLDSGAGDDTVTGGEGFDIFIDAGGTDTLIETQDADLSLFGNRFVVGELVMSEESPETESMLRDRMYEDDPDFIFGEKGDHYAANAIVEDIDNIFEIAILNGGSGNNTMVVGDMDSSIKVGAGSIAVTPWTGTVSLDNKGNEQDAFPEYYIINVSGKNGTSVNINDSGAGSGFDYLVVNGTHESDNITLDAAGSGAFRSGSIITGDITDLIAREVITYKQVERVAVNTYAGDDYFLSNDTVVVTILNMGSGDDEIVVGTVPLIPDPGNRTLEFPDGVPVADTANMTNGNSAPLYVLGYGQNDRFEVNHNRARLFLHGGAGNDRFLLKTFLVLRENADNPDEVTNLSSMFGGTGLNRYDYLQNAPVFINGGPGIDTIVVTGTPIGDIFVVTDTYIAGGGRITNFTNIESIEVDSGGGPDQIYILSTGESFETTVVGGSGDDTIHIGGDHPPLVFDPPPYTYTPPAIEVQLPPEVVYTPYTLNLSGATFEVDLWRYLAHWEDPNYFVEELVNSFEAIGNLIFPYFNLHGSDYSGVHARVRFHFFWWWFGTKVQITVDNFVIDYSIGHLESRSKLVQPPDVIVDPPAFAFKEARSFDASKILGRLTIKGGDQFETDGDKLIVHNQDGSSAPGLLTNRITPRMVQVDEDQDGNPIFEQDTDETGQLIEDTFQSLEGIGLPTGVGLDTVPFSGVEIKGIEDIELRLADGNDDFTVAVTEYHRTESGQDVMTYGDPLEDITLTIVTGAGDDTVNIEQIGGETMILGDSGDDRVNVNHENPISGIDTKIVFDGDAHIEEQVVRANASEYDPNLLNNLPIVFVNSEPGLFFVDSSGARTDYALPQMAPIIIQGAGGELSVRVVVLNDNGEALEDFVQEKGVQERGVQKEDGQGNPLFYTEDGDEITTNTGIPVILTDPNGAPVYLDESFRKTFINTGRKSYLPDFENGNLLYVNYEGVRVEDDTLVVDGAGADFTVYEVDGGAVEFGEISVQVSNNGTNWATLNPLPGVRIEGDGQHSGGGFFKSYNLSGSGLSSARHIRIKGISGGSSGGFDLDAIGIIHGGPNAPIWPSIFRDSTGSDLDRIGGAPDDSYIDLGNRTVTYVAVSPSIIPVNRTKVIPFERTEDTYETYPGALDSLYIVNSGDSADDSATLDKYQIPVDQFDQDGKPIFHDDSSSPDPKSYFGGEPVIDPFTLEPLYYQGGEPVLDLFSKQPVLDPFGNPVLHKAGDPVLHFAGDPVVHFTGEVQNYLGGEQVYDEKGDPVYNSDNSPFLHEPGQAKIHNRRELVFEMIDENGQRVELGTPYTPPTFNSELTNGTVLNLDDLNSGDIVRVTVFNGTQIYRLAETEFIVDTAQNRITLDPVTEITDPVTIKVVIATQAFNEAGDPKLYFGDEYVEVGQPVVDFNGNIKLDETGKAILHTTDTIMHSRGEPVYDYIGGDTTSPDSWVQATYSGGEPRYTLGNEPKRYLGGEQAYYTAADPVQAAETYQRVGIEDQQTGSGEPGVILYRGLNQVDVTLGTGDNLVTVVNTHLAITEINTGSGEDRIAIRDIEGETTINGDDGNDLIHVGSFSGLWETATDTFEFMNVNGQANEIRDLLVINGNEGDDRVHIDDTWDTGPNVGILTSTTLTGIFGNSGSMTYGTIETLDIDLGSGGDTMSIQSSHAGLTYIETRAGSDTVNVSSNAPGTGGTLNGIAGTLILDGGEDSNSLAVNDTGDADDNQGILYSDAIVGLGMTDGVRDGIRYVHFSTLALQLGPGSDDLYIESTHIGQTTINSGGGDDVVNIRTISGMTEVSAGEGNDILRLHYDRSGQPTNTYGFLGTDLTLDLHGQDGSDIYDIDLTGGGDALINITDQSNGDPGVDWLNIYGTVNADFFLSRPGAILSPEVDENRVPLPNGGMERVNYAFFDGSNHVSDINGGINLYGRGGDDTFVFDDTSSSMTVYGDAGNDTFQVGQVFKSPRDASAGLDIKDQFPTTLTTRGYLSNGISHPVTIYGGIGKDSFTVYRNIADLFLYGEEDDDSFKIQAFVTTDDVHKPITNVNGGQGADFIEYTVNDLINIEGGDGFDTVFITGTEYGDDFIVTKDGVLGAGLPVSFHGVEQITVDGREGNDTFFVVSSWDGTLVELVGGLGSDEFNVAGGNEGKPITVVSKDPEAKGESHSGLIDHTISVSDTYYQDVFVQDLSAIVYDNDEAGVVLSPIDNFMTVIEGSDFDVKYAVILTRAPEEDVLVTVAPGQPKDDEIAVGGRGVEVNIDADRNNVADSSWSSGGATLIFNRDNWYLPQNVWVKAAQDDLAEGLRFVTIQHTTQEGRSQGDGDDYDNVSVSTMVIEVVDDDAASVLITPSSAEPTVREDGSTSITYTMQLTKAPEGPVKVSLFAEEGISFSSSWIQSSKTVTFINGPNWADRQTVTVYAVDDALREGVQYSRITHQIAVEDYANFMGLERPDVLSGLESIINRDLYVDTTAIADITNSTLTINGAIETVTSSFDSNPILNPSTAELWTENVVELGGTTADNQDWTVTLNGVVAAMYTASGTDSLTDVATALADVMDQNYQTTAEDNILTIRRVDDTPFTSSVTADSGGSATLSGTIYREYSLFLADIAATIESGDTWTVTLNDTVYPYTAGRNGELFHMSAVDVKVVDDDVPDVLILQTEGTTQVAEPTYYVAMGTGQVAKPATNGTVIENKTVDLTGAIVGATNSVWTVALNGIDYSYKVPTDTTPIDTVGAELASKIDAILGYEGEYDANDDTLTVRNIYGFDFDLTITGPNNQTFSVTETTSTNTMFEGYFGTPVINETGADHSSITSAQNLDFGLWGINADAEILKSTEVPHLTVLGTGNGKTDYYTFEITQQMLDDATDDAISATFDIDHGFEWGDRIIWGSWLKLYNAGGNLIARGWGWSYPGEGAQGSTSWLDDYLAYTFTQPGTYSLEVDNWLWWYSYWLTGRWGGIPLGVDYELQISIENHPSHSFQFSTSPVYENELDNDSGQSIDTATNWYNLYNADIGNQVYEGSVNSSTPYVQIIGKGDGTSDIYEFVVTPEMLERNSGTFNGTDDNLARAYYTSANVVLQGKVNPGDIWTLVLNGMEYHYTVKETDSSLEDVATGLSGLLLPLGNYSVEVNGGSLEILDNIGFRVDNLEQKVAVAGRVERVNQPLDGNGLLDFLSAEVALSGTPVASEVWNVILNGTAYGYTVQAGDGLTEVYQGLVSSDNPGAIPAAIFNVTNTGSLLKIGKVDGGSFTVEVLIAGAAPQGEAIVSGKPFDQTMTLDALNTKTLDFNDIEWTSTQLKLQGTPRRYEVWQVILNGTAYSVPVINADLDSVGNALVSAIPGTLTNFTNKEYIAGDDILNLVSTTPFTIGFRIISVKDGTFTHADVIANTQRIILEGTPVVGDTWRLMDGTTELASHTVVSGSATLAAIAQGLAADLDTLDNHAAGSIDSTSVYVTRLGTSTPLSLALKVDSAVAPATETAVTQSLTLTGSAVVDDVWKLMDGTTELASHTVLSGSATLAGVAQGLAADLESNSTEYAASGDTTGKLVITKTGTSTPLSLALKVDSAVAPATETAVTQSLTLIGSAVVDDVWKLMDGTTELASHTVLSGSATLAAVAQGLAADLESNSTEYAASGDTTGKLVITKTGTGTPLNLAVRLDGDSSVSMSNANTKTLTLSGTPHIGEVWNVYINGNTSGDIVATETYDTEDFLGLVASLTDQINSQTGHIAGFEQVGEDYQIIISNLDENSYGTFDEIYGSIVPAVPVGSAENSGTIKKNWSQFIDLDDSYDTRTNELWTISIDGQAYSLTVVNEETAADVEATFSTHPELILSVTAVVENGRLKLTNTDNDTVNIQSITWLRQGYDASGGLPASDPVKDTTEDTTTAHYAVAKEGGTPKLVLDIDPYTTVSSGQKWNVILNGDNPFVYKVPAQPPHGYDYLNILLLRDKLTELIDNSDNYSASYLGNKISIWFDNSYSGPYDTIVATSSVGSAEEGLAGVVDVDYGNTVTDYKIYYTTEWKPVTKWYYANLWNMFWGVKTYYEELIQVKKAHNVNYTDSLYIELLDANNSQIAESKVSTRLDQGSNSTADPFIDFDIRDPGTYKIHVGTFRDYDDNPRFQDEVFNYVSTRLSYQLNVSLPGHAVNESTVTLDGKRIEVVSGPGEGQEAIILHYDPNSQQFILDRAWDESTLPNEFSLFEIGYDLADQFASHPLAFDEYSVVLSQPPDAAQGKDIVVDVLPQLTRTYNSDLAFDATANYGENEAVQVKVGTKRVALRFADIPQVGDEWTFALTNASGNTTSVSHPLTANDLNNAFTDLITKMVGTQAVEMAGNEVVMTFDSELFVDEFIVTISGVGEGSVQIVPQVAFTSDNWDTPQRVLVQGLDDSVIDGSDAVSIPGMGEKLYDIRGPIVIDGGNRANYYDALNNPFTLPNETNWPLADGAIYGMDTNTATATIIDPFAMHIDSQRGEMPGLDPRIREYQYTFTVSDGPAQGTVLMAEALSGHTIAIKSENPSDTFTLSVDGTTAGVTGYASDESLPYSEADIILTYGGTVKDGQVWTITLDNIPYSYTTDILAGELTLEKVASGIRDAITDASYNIEVIGCTLHIENTAGFTVKPLQVVSDGETLSDNIARIVGTPKDGTTGVSWKWLEVELTSLPAVGSSLMLTINGSKSFSYTINNNDTLETVAEELAELVDADEVFHAEIKYETVIFEDTWGTGSLPLKGNAYFYRPYNPNYAVVETLQVDTLNVYHGNSVSTDNGTLTEERLYGLGMGGDTFIGDTLIKGGLTYYNLESMNLELGEGDNTFIIESTHTGSTWIASGEGADTINIESIAGHTFINTGVGTDIVNVGDARHLVDRIAALLTVTDEDTLGSTVVDEIAGSVTFSGPVNGGEIWTITIDDTEYSYQAISGDDIQTLAQELSAKIPGATFSGAVVNLPAGVTSVTAGVMGDTLNVDDSGDSKTNSGTLTQTTLTGLNMPAVAEVQDVWVQAKEGTYRLTAKGTLLDGAQFLVLIDPSGAPLSVDVETPRFSSSSINPVVAPVAVFELSGNVTNNDVWTVQINGFDYSYSVQVGDSSLEDISSGLAAAISGQTVNATAIVLGSQLVVIQVSGEPFKVQVIAPAGSTATMLLDPLMLTTVALKGSAFAGDTWSITVNDKTFSYMVQGGDTLATVVEKIAEQIALNTPMLTATAGYAQTSLDYSWNATQIRDKLRHLYASSSIDVTETRDNHAVLYRITYAGEFVGLNIPMLEWSDTDATYNLIPEPNASAVVRVSAFHQGMTAPTINNLQTLTVDGEGSFMIGFRLDPDSQNTITWTESISSDAPAGVILEKLSKVLDPNNSYDDRPHTRNVAVTRIGNVIEIIFQGQHGDLSILTDDILAAGCTVHLATRVDGINYYEIVSLNIDLGSAGDVFNIQSTREGTVTNLNTQGGNDAVYVSSKANIGLADSVEYAVTTAPTSSETTDLHAIVFDLLNENPGPNQDWMITFDNGTQFSTYNTGSDSETIDDLINGLRSIISSYETMDNDPNGINADRLIVIGSVTFTLAECYILKPDSTKIECASFNARSIDLPDSYDTGKTWSLILDGTDRYAYKVNEGDSYNNDMSGVVAALVDKINSETFSTGYVANVDSVDNSKIVITQSGSFTVEYTETSVRTGAAATIYTRRISLNETDEDVLEGKVWTVTLNGEDVYDYTAQAGDMMNDVLAGLVNEINNDNNEAGTVETYTAVADTEDGQRIIISDTNIIHAAEYMVAMETSEDTTTVYSISVLLAETDNDVIEGKVWTVILNGEDIYSYNSQTGETMNDVATGLVNAINNDNNEAGTVETYTAVADTENDQRIIIHDTSSIYWITFDFLHGDLNSIKNTLNIDVDRAPGDTSGGDDTNTLMISDFNDTTGDGTIGAPVLIDNGLIRGLAPSDITYRTDHTEGNFSGGITIWSGSGDDIINVEGTHRSSNEGTIRTITTLNTNAGDDEITIILDPSNDGFFALNTEEGDDLIIIKGGEGRVDGGMGDDDVFIDDRVGSGDFFVTDDGDLGIVHVDLESTVIDSIVGNDHQLRFPNYTVNFDDSVDELIITDNADTVITSDVALTDLGAVKMTLSAKRLTVNSEMNGSILIFDIQGDITVNKDITVEGTGLINAVSHNGSIHFPAEPVFTAIQGVLILDSQGVEGTIYTQVQDLTVRNTGLGALADIVIREVDNLTIQDSGFVPGGIYSAAGGIDIVLAAADALLTLNSGTIHAGGLGQGIRIIADDIDFVAGENTISGTGELRIRTQSDAYDYRIGSGAEAHNGDDLSGTGANGSLDLSMRDLAALVDGFSLISIGHEHLGNRMTIGDVENADEVKGTGEPRVVHAVFKDPVSFYSEWISIQGDVKALNNSLEFYANIIEIDSKNLHDPNGPADSGITAGSIFFDADEQMIVGGWVTASNSLTINVHSTTGSNNVISLPDGPNSLSTYEGSAMATLNDAGTLTVITSQSIKVTGTVTANGNGRIDLSADAGSVTLAGSVFSDSGSIAVSGDSVMQSEGGNIKTSGSGTVTVTADNGSITMADDTSTVTDTGNINYSATADVALSVLSSTSGELFVTAGIGTSYGAISDSLSTESANLITEVMAILTAETGIGAEGDEDIDTAIGTLDATNRVSGDIYVQEIDGLIISDNGIKTLNGNGAIFIDVDSGGLTIKGVITSHGIGPIDLNADLGPVILDAKVSSTSGHIKISGDGVTQNLGGNIVTGGSGTVTIIADNGSITMVSDTSTVTDTGSINYSATADVALSVLSSTSGELFVTAGSGDSETGAITDNLDIEATNLITAAMVNLTAATGIGAEGDADIDTAIGTLEATNRVSGDIFIQEIDGLIIAGSGVSTLGNNGAIVIISEDQAITVNSSVAADGSGNILMMAQSAGSVAHIHLNATVTSDAGYITILAADDITQAATGHIITAGPGNIYV
ncbi:hypothetical protein ACFL7M_09040, partial [Thermodesulfobacteriota bacterium]